MHLSQIGSVISATILRDGQFSALGLLSHDSGMMLVGFYDRSYFDRLITNPNVTCVITSPDLALLLPERLAVAVCEDPKTCFYQAHNHLLKHTGFYWTDFDSEIAPDAVVHQRAYVAPKNVRIGAGSIIEPNATILERSIIGRNVIIRAGAVIGGEGFEPKFVGGKHVVVPHAGGVLLHDEVEVQACTHIARSVFGGFTEIGEATKVDALVHIAHNVRVGSHCEITACVMVAGSVVIGDNVFIGPNASISSEVRIGNGAFVTLGSVVTKDVADGQRVSGNFAIEHSRFIAFMKSVR